MQAPYFSLPLVFFDQDTFRQNLATSEDRISVFKDAIEAANAHFDKRFWDGADIRSLVRERAVFVDCILHYAWHSFEWCEDCGLLAVGGYGREELHPYSDIDILILFLEDEVES